MALNTLDIDPDIWNKALQYWCLGSLYVLMTDTRWKWMFQGTTLYFYFVLELKKKISVVGRLKPCHKRALPPLVIPHLSLCHTAGPYARSQLFHRWSQTELCILYNGTQKEVLYLSFFCFLKTLEFNNHHFNILCFSFRKWAWLEGC